MEKLSYVDQAVNSPVLEFITESGRTIEVQESLVLDFIEVNGLNYESLVVGNTSTGMYRDPCYDIEVETITDASVYLDNNFDQVCADYFNSILLPNLLKHVA